MRLWLFLAISTLCLLLALPREISARRRQSHSQRGAGAWVLVTGANGGIGRRVTRLLLEEGCTVVAVTRNASAALELQGQRSERLLVFEFDLEKYDAFQDEFEPFMRSHGLQITRLLALVSNAGAGQLYPFESTNYAEKARYLAANLHQHAHLATYFALEAARQGRHLNVIITSSLMAWIPLPRMTLYHMAKAGLLGLASDLAALPGVTATAVCPTVVRQTGFYARHAMRDARSTVSDGLERCSLLSVSAEKVAQIIADKCFHVAAGGARVVCAGWQAAVVRVGRSLAGSWITALLSSWVVLGGAWPSR